MAGWGSTVLFCRKSAVPGDIMKTAASLHELVALSKFMTEHANASDDGTFYQLGENCTNSIYFYGIHLRDNTLLLLHKVAYW